MRLNWQLSDWPDFRFDAERIHASEEQFLKGSGVVIGALYHLDADARVPDFTARLNHVTSFAALRLGWTPTLRSTLMGSYQNAKYPNGFPVATFDAYNDEAWSVAGNLFWSPVKGFDLGVEYRHGERILVSGANGQLSRVEFAAKYSF